MSQRILIIPALAVLLGLTACSNADPAKTQAEVEKAQAEAQKIVADA